MTLSSNKGKVLITGASSGIGAIYADRFARRGYDLILVARDGARLAGVADRIARSVECKIEVVPADLTLKSELKRVEDRLRSDSGISVLVNNAGFGGTAKLAESNIEEMDSMIQLDVVALTRLALAVLPGMIARGGGTIINIASIVAIAPELLNGVYGASKAYVLALSQSLSSEVSAKGVHVQAVLPGAIATEFWDKAGLPVSNLPQEMVMQPDELVDAALAGLDLRELVTIPSLPDAKDWEDYNLDRLSMRSKLSHTYAAAVITIAFREIGASVSSRASPLAGCQPMPGRNGDCLPGPGILLSLCISSRPSSGLLFSCPCLRRTARRRTSHRESFCVPSADLRRHTGAVLRRRCARSPEDGQSGEAKTQVWWRKNQRMPDALTSKSRFLGLRSSQALCTIEMTLFRI